MSNFENLLLQIWKNLLHEVTKRKKKKSWNRIAHMSALLFLAKFKVKNSKECLLKNIQCVHKGLKSKSRFLTFSNFQTSTFSKLKKFQNFVDVTAIWLFSMIMTIAFFGASYGHHSFKLFFCIQKRWEQPFVFPYPVASSSCTELPSLALPQLHWDVSLLLTFGHSLQEPHCSWSRGHHTWSHTWSYIPSIWWQHLWKK